MTGGAAFGPVQTGLNPPSTFDSATKLGWAAGAGVEFAFSGNWSAKAEYLFVDLAMSSCSTVANCGTATGSSVAFIESLGARRRQLQIFLVVAEAAREQRGKQDR